MTYKNPKKKLWQLTSLYVRLRDTDDNGFTNCVCCGTSKHYKQLDCGHFISKNKGLSIYFELKNLAPCCYSCNRFSAGNLPGFANYLIKKYGIGIIDELQARQKVKVFYKEIHYLVMIQEMKANINKLNKGSLM